MAIKIRWPWKETTEQRQTRVSSTKDDFEFNMIIREQIVQCQEKSSALTKAIRWLVSDD